MSEELTNMQENVIEDKKIEKSDPIEVLVNHDFNSDNEINLEESYELIQEIDKSNSEAKNNEAENIIADLSDKYINQEYHEKLQQTINNFKSFIKKYDVNSELIKNASDSEKTKYYGICSFLSKNIMHQINDMTFSLMLTREEYQLIQTALERRLTYDGNEVFNIIELNDKYLKKWKELNKSLPKDVPSFIVDIDIKNVVMLYHFLQKNEVKGINRDFYVFADVLQKIADTNKIYNAYNVIKDRLTTDFNVWISALDESKKSETKSETKLENIE